MLTQLSDWVPVAAGGVAVLSALVVWLRWVRPRIRATKADFTAAKDAIVGRPAIRDSITGREIEPALPGVGVRLAGLELAIQKLADSHVRLDTQQGQLGALAERTKRNEDDIEILKAASVERVVARSESARAWAAMEAVALSTPDHIDVRDPDHIEDEGRGDK